MLIASPYLFLTATVVDYFPLTVFSCHCLVIFMVVDPCRCQIPKMFGLVASAYFITDWQPLTLSHSAWIHVFLLCVRMWNIGRLGGKQGEILKEYGKRVVVRFLKVTLGGQSYRMFGMEGILR